MKKIDKIIKKRQELLRLILIFFSLAVFLLLTTIIINWKFLTTDLLKQGLEEKSLFGCVCYKEGGYTCYQYENGFKCVKNSFVNKELVNGARINISVFS